jgi:limonene-1,2-epoxide hydrolase
MRVIVKTTAKMSDAGRAAIADVPLGPGARRLLEEALARDVVARYLAGLAAHDWDAVAATLDRDVERRGPYGDGYRGRMPYAAFLNATISALGGYELVVKRMIADGGRVAVELSETVDDGDGRLQTDETVVFDVTNGYIRRVAVYLQTSQRLPGGD